ncbi:MAG: SpoIVB peptidase [Defluviitaleaceae bacterium]|nr:SpoIVB peptidase [Defluviitaleaceae bacterium]
MRHKIKLISILALSVVMGWFSGLIAGQLSIPETVHTYKAESDLISFNLPFRKPKPVASQETPITVVPLGMTIGVRINTEGVMVLGTGSFLGDDGRSHTPSDGLLRGGDLIIRANDKPIECKETLSQLVADSTCDVVLLLRRDGNEFEVTLTPALAATDGVRRIGIWVRDSTKGIGTLTYYVPGTGAFGALGHGIMDVDTKKLISVKDGVVMHSTVTAIVKGQRGKPGELEGTVDTGNSLGSVLINSPSGIYGVLEQSFIATLPTEAMPIATRNQIKEGPATILTNVVGNEVRAFEISIEGVNRSAIDETKGMIIRITDPDLLAATNGIVQGMSGSPIIQDGRIVGAITHVFVQDPAKGYGIFIETMLEQGGGAAFDL